MQVYDFKPILVSDDNFLNAHDYPIEICTWYNEVNQYRTRCYYENGRFRMAFKHLPGMRPWDINMDIFHHTSPIADFGIWIDGREWFIENVGFYK